MIGFDWLLDQKKRGAVFDFGMLVGILAATAAPLVAPLLLRVPRGTRAYSGGGVMFHVEQTEEQKMGDWI